MEEAASSAALLSGVDSMERASEADSEAFAAPSAELLASLQGRFDNFAQGLPVLSGSDLHAEEGSADETPARNKFRRRWSQPSPSPPTPLHPELAPSPGKSSWEVIHVVDDEDEPQQSPGWSISGNSASFPLMRSGSTRPRPSLVHLSKASPWSPRPICLRYNSPFRLGCTGKVPRAPVPSTVACFSAPRPGSQLRPTQHSFFPAPGQPKPLPIFKAASAYAVYPKHSCSVIQESISTPTPRPIPRATALVTGSWEPLPQPKVASALSPAVTTSSGLHAVKRSQNEALFQDLCDAHGRFSEVLSQLSASQHGAAIRKRLLTKVSDTTAARYLRSVQLFFTTFEELGGSLEEVDQGLFLDSFFSLSRSLEDGPLSNSQNVLKALRWYSKLLRLSVLPDLYSPAFSTLASSSAREKRESVPLPLVLHAFLEGQVLSPETPVDKALFCGSVLICIGGSLRFADAQHVAWTSLCPSSFSLRGICYRTKTTATGEPFGLIGFGLHSASEEWGANWLSRWILLLDDVWQGLRSRFGQDLVPDCLFFHFSASGFAPASYAQTLCRLRQLLLEAAVPASQVGAYTLHSMKSTYLSWMAQLNLPLSARFLQGHHKIPGSAQLYSRDDIWPALRAQLLLWRSLHGGFRPLCPQHRGGQQPLAEPTVVLDKITWHVEPRRPTCFMLCDDSGTFLRMQASDKDLAEALEASEPGQGRSPCLPRCVHVMSEVPSFADSDGEEPNASEVLSEDSTLTEVAPTWRGEESLPLADKVVPKAPPQPGPACALARFLISPSGVAHAAIIHSGSRKICLVCNLESCTARRYPACGCLSEFSASVELPPNARLCRRRACVIASAAD